MSEAQPLEPAPLIPRRAFFSDPDRKDVLISPDGRHVSYGAGDVPGLAEALADGSGGASPGAACIQ